TCADVPRRRPAGLPRAARTFRLGAATRLRDVRVRTLELRLIGLVLGGCWIVAAAYVLVGYRPGGPIDIAVGVAALLPAAVAFTGVVWPPVARGDRSFAAITWLAAASLLVLIPSIADVASQIGGGGAQTLLPSVESAYPWVLGLLGTCLFTGFGIARRRLGPSALQRRRLVRGMLVATVLAVGSGLIFTAVAMANELALRDRTFSTSRFGPTTPDVDPPLCDGPIGVGAVAHVSVHLEGTIDGRSLGTVDISGDRSGPDVRWLGYVASSQRLGLYGAATVGSHHWIREPYVGWRPATTFDVGDDELDVTAFGEALVLNTRAAAQTDGVTIIEGARARQCRITIDGPTFLRAFPQAAWLVGSADLAHWRGQLAYWVFVDGQIGRLAGSVNGDAADIQPDALQATVRVELSATDRHSTSIVVTPPVP
ncbi:MAG TPA: hypothetical protein VFP22_08495, partial [Candidatus Limnocylindrales bacterium]|nr:hypothetical protein [Candidatus Limnocylindrales bacterium]